MAKFYVQSGTLNAVVDSADPQRAALWAVHQAMQQIAPIDDPVPASQHVSSTTAELQASHFKPQSFIALGDTIRLSEVGFDQDNAVSIDTFEAFREWHALWHALENMAKNLGFNS